MSDHSHTHPAQTGTIDKGRRDPDYPHRAVLPWRTKGVENYTICCPRCRSYRLSSRAFITVGELGVHAPFTCDECGHDGTIGFFTTRHGLMLATD